MSTPLFNIFRLHTLCMSQPCISQCVFHLFIPANRLQDHQAHSYKRMRVLYKVFTKKTSMATFLKCLVMPQSHSNTFDQPFIILVEFKKLRIMLDLPIITVMYSRLCCYHHVALYLLTGNILMDVLSNNLLFILMSLKFGPITFSAVSLQTASIVVGNTLEQQTSRPLSYDIVES